MSNQVTVQELLERNKQKAATNPPNFPHFSELEAAGLAKIKVAIFACADPRCVPEQILDLKPFEAVVFRNPCGHVAPNFEGLLAIDAFIDTFEEIMIIHHTDCGALHINEAGIREALKKYTGSKRSLDRLWFGAVTDIKQSVLEDLAELRENPLVRPALKAKSSGYVYDVKTGLLTNVEE